MLECTVCTEWFDAAVAYPEIPAGVLASSLAVCRRCDDMHEHYGIGAYAD